jgi:hypothetical protein
MKTAGWLLAVFALQLGVPASMIVTRERVLRRGTTYRFKTVPVDPYDALRGRYVDLRFEQSRAQAPDGISFQAHAPVFVSLEVGADGFARFGTALEARPKAGPYLRARVAYSTSGSVGLVLPFDRFYMDEKLAPDAERLYREHSRRGESDAYVTVRIADGDAAIENLYIGGRPIAEVLRARH